MLLNNINQQIAHVLLKHKRKSNCSLILSMLRPSLVDAHKCWGIHPSSPRKLLSAEGEEMRNNYLFLPSSQGSSTCSPGPGLRLALGQTNAAAEAGVLAVHTDRCSPRADMWATEHWSRVKC